MNWLQFHFKCRFYFQKISQGASTEEAERLFNEAGLSELYSEKESTGLPKELFKKITSLTQSNEIKSALKIFSSLNFSENLATSKTMKGITDKLSYLEAITVVFLVFISIYKFFVYPVFVELMLQQPHLETELFSLFPSMWFIGITIALLTYIFTFSYRKYLKNIDAVVINQPSKARKFFTPQNVLTEIQALHQIITLPLANKQSECAFHLKIKKLSEMGLDESVEVSYLYQHHANKLDIAIGRHANKIFAILYALITINIGFYIMQVYEPIFQLGALIE